MSKIMPVVMYRAEDGSLHESEDAALGHNIERHWRDKIGIELGNWSDADDIYEWIIENTKGFKLTEGKT